MSQQNINPELCRSKACIETAYGTPDTFTDFFNLESDAVPECMQTENAIMDASLYMHDDQAPTFGLKSWTWKPSILVRPSTTRLNAAASPSTPPNLIPLKGILGQYVAAGSTVEASPSPTATGFTVASGHGARFRVNQIIIVNGEWTVITGISTDALTLGIALSDAPSASDVVYNTYNFWPDPANAQSMAFQHFKHDSDQQYKLFGGTGGVEFSLDHDKNIMLAYNLRGKNHERGALSISVDYAADTQGSPFNFSLGECCLVDPTATVRTLSTVEKFTVKIEDTMDFVKEVTGASSASARQGHTTTYRKASKKFATVTIRHRYDPDAVTTWQAQTTLRFVMAFSQGSGTSRRWFAIHMPRCRIIGSPKEPADNSRSWTEFTLCSAIDATATTDFARSPFICAIG